MLLNRYGVFVNVTRPSRQKQKKKNIQHIPIDLGDKMLTANIQIKLRLERNIVVYATPEDVVQLGYDPFLN